MQQGLTILKKDKFSLNKKVIHKYPEKSYYPSEN